LRSEHFTQKAPDHLPGRHAATSSDGFKLHCLPERQQEGKLNDFLVHPIGI
jgi:hypothetical protein